MHVVHLMASPFFGGPERQVLGLARSLPHYRTTFLTFAERGLSRPFCEKAREYGFEAIVLQENTPRPLRASAEIADHLRRLRADVLCCNGYKPDILGYFAARRAGVPVVAIAHGWTGITWKVRANELLDRLVLHGMDCTVCVSEAQAAKVRRALVPARRVVVIRNGIFTEPFDQPDPSYRNLLHDYFPRRPALIVGAAGRLSPEKGFDQFIDAAAIVCQQRADVGFVLFGCGPLRATLEQRIAAHGLSGRFVLAGFRDDVERFLPHLDLAVLSSHTEGLPVAVLEAMAARLPVVATAVGGTPEVVEDGVTGHLVPAGDRAALASRIADILADGGKRRLMGQRGRQRVEAQFTFAAQGRRYQALFERLPASAATGTATVRDLSDPPVTFVAPRHVPTEQL
jgi:glycosyltransferase involved in cell wall biosynthesis